MKKKFLKKVEKKKKKKKKKLDGQTGSLLYAYVLCSSLHEFIQVIFSEVYFVFC